MIHGMDMRIGVLSISKVTIKSSKRSQFCCFPIKVIFITKLCDPLLSLVPIPLAYKDDPISSSLKIPTKKCLLHLKLEYN